MYRDVAIEGTAYFGFATNDTGGSGADATTTSAYARHCGIAAGSAPITSGLTVSLLSHADYPAGSYEVAVAATAGNGFTTSAYYTVWVSAGVDSESPTGKIGDLYVTPSGDDLASAAARIIDVTDADSVILDATQRSAITTAVLEGDWSSYEAAAKNATSSKVGHALAGVRSMALGRLTISGNTLTAYEADGTTVLATFTLASDRTTRSTAS